MTSSDGKQVFKDKIDIMADNKDKWVDSSSIIQFKDDSVQVSFKVD